MSLEQRRLVDVVAEHPEVAEAYDELFVLLRGEELPMLATVNGTFRVWIANVLTGCPKPSLAAALECAIHSLKRAGRA